MSDELSGVCGKCRSNTVFERDPYNDDLLSVCCSWGPYNPPEEDGA